MARIGAAHGIRGEVRIQSFTEDPMALAAYGPLSTNRPGLTVTVLEVDGLRVEKVLVERSAPADS